MRSERKSIERHISVVVISNQPDAAGLKRAEQAGIETVVLDHADKAQYPTREDYDRELVRVLKERDVSALCASPVSCVC